MTKGAYRSSAPSGQSADKGPRLDAKHISRHATVKGRMDRRNATIVFVRPGDVAIEHGAVPHPDRGSALIKTRKTLISTGTELTILSGRFPRDSAWSRYGRFPFIPGYNNVGEVVEAGEDVDREWVGRRVASYGHHALFVTEELGSLRLIEPGISDEDAVFFTIAEIVMNGVRRGGVRFGESVVIYGAGLLGQLAARICRLCGARPVFVVDVADFRLAKLPEDPRIVRVNPRKENVASVVRESTKKRMADVVFEVTGDQALIPDEFLCLREQGRFVVLSSPRGPTSFDFHDLCNYPSFTIVGAHNMSHPKISTPDNPWTNQRHAELYFDLVHKGELDVSRLVTHRVPYHEAPRIYQELLKDRSQAMAVVLDWTAQS